MQLQSVDPTATAKSRTDQLDSLRQAIDHAAHLLPAQGPITVFIHHNTLHAFEDLWFDDGIKKGSRIFGNQPYLSEERFRAEFARGRISGSDLISALWEDLGTRGDELVLSLCTRIQLRMAMLQYPLRQAPAAELRWFIAETDALQKYRSDVPQSVRHRFLQATRHWALRDLRMNVGASGDAAQAREHHLHESLVELVESFNEQPLELWSDDSWEAFSLHALWRICRNGAHVVKLPQTAPVTPLRQRDLLLQATGEDSDELSNELLIRFSAAFLDQGFSPWPLPERDEGFFKSFSAMYSQPGRAL